MRNRDPLLTMAIVKHGWLDGHSLYRAARHCKQRRSCWVASALLALAVVGLGVIQRAPKNSYHAAKPATDIEGPKRGEVHSTRKTDDLAHGRHHAIAHVRGETMKCSWFQGAP
jgi:hypothetical protein